MEHVKRLARSVEIRHGQVFFLFSGYAIAYIIRTTMSVSIVAMTDTDSDNPNVTIFDWDSKQRSMILSSLLWGAVASQIPIGFLVQNLGGTHKMLICGMLISSLIMLLTPFLSYKLGWIAVLVTRIIIGISQGTLIPCMKIQISNWVPLSERAQLGSFILNGPQLGNVFAMFLSGILAATSFGWPSIFYTFGSIGVVWSLLYWWFGAESPDQHKSISLTEKLLFENSLGKSSDEKKRPFPWRDVLTSLPVWSLLFSEVCHIWSYYMLLSELPLFMKSVLKFDIKQSGILSAIPYMTKWLIAFPIGWASDFALGKGVSVTIIRKVANCIGMWGPALMLLILCLINSSDKTLSVTLMILAVGLNAGNLCGQEMNEIDIAPNFIGMLSSIINAVGKVFGFIAPLAFGIIVTDSENIDQWHIIFYTSVAGYFLGNLGFIIFGKAEVQPWNGEMPSTASNIENIKKMSIISRISNIHENNIGIRHKQVVLIFLGYMISFSIRTFMGVAIVAMTDPDSKIDGVQTYNWTISQQSYIQSALLWGCVVSQLPSGYIMNYSGYHKFLCVGILCSSAVTMITPWIAAYTGWIGVMCSRLFLGLGQGCLVPGVKGLVAKWIPISERAQLGALVLNSPELGNMIAMLLSGVLAESSLGWPSIFYTFGSAGVLWSILFFWLGSDSPTQHKTITLEEREFILNSLGEEKKERVFPWKAAFSSMAVWALLLANVCNIWNYYILLAELPSYTKYILNFSTGVSGYISALFLLLRWLFAFPVGLASDYFLQKGVSVVTIRKISNSVALWGPAVALLALCILRTNDKITAVSLMAIVVSLNSAIACGQEINEIDIAPNFTGILSSITNSVGKIFGFLSTIAFSGVVKDMSNIDEWNVMFYISVFLFFIGNLAFVIFGKAEIEPWNGEVEKETDKERIKKLSVISRISSIHES